MQFFYPGFLFALTAIIIPVIIHLFRFRRYRKVYFPNVKLIEDLKLETQRRSKLKHLLVLASRILAIVSLVFAFAQPYKPLQTGENASGARRHVVVFLDNSFSMENVSTEGTLLQIGKDKSGEVALAYGPADQFALLTNDFEGRHQRFYSREDFQDLLESVEVSPVNRSLQEVFVRASDLFREQSSAGELFVISDFQRSMVGEAMPVPDSLLKTFLFPLSANSISNLYIDSCWFASPARYSGQQAKLTARLMNTGNSDYEKVPIRLKLNGEQRAIATVDIPAGQSQEVTMSFSLDEEGWYHGAIEITDYPVTYDDLYYLAFPVSGRIPVLSVYEKEASPFLSRLFANDSAFNFSETGVLSIDYGRLGEYGLIVLDGLNTISSGLSSELQAFVENGGSLLVFPGADIDQAAINPFLASVGLVGLGAMDTAATRVAGLDQGHPLFEGVFEGTTSNESQRIDLPLVFAHYPATIPARGAHEILLGMDNGRPFLVSSSMGKGSAYLFVVPLDEKSSSLPRHAIIVPVLYRMALLSRPLQELSSVIGEDPLVRMTDAMTDAEVLTIVNQSSGVEIIPEMRRQGSELILNTHDQIRENGIYEIRDKDKVLAYSAYNYDRAESALESIAAPELEDMAEAQGVTRLKVLNAATSTKSKLIAELSEGVRYWKWFLWLALIFLLAEVLLLRFMKS